MSGRESKRKLRRVLNASDGMRALAGTSAATHTRRALGAVRSQAQRVLVATLATSRLSEPGWRLIKENSTGDCPHFRVLPVTWFARYLVGALSWQ